MWLWPNLVLGAFNLIPAPRLDGAKAWRIFRPDEIKMTVLHTRASLIERELEAARIDEREPKSKYDIN